MNTPKSPEPIFTPNKLVNKNVKRKLEYYLEDEEYKKEKEKYIIGELTMEYINAVLGLPK